MSNPKHTNFIEIPIPEELKTHYLFKLPLFQNGNKLNLRLHDDVALAQSPSKNNSDWIGVLCALILPGIDENLDLSLYYHTKNGKLAWNPTFPQTISFDESQLRSLEDLTSVIERGYTYGLPSLEEFEAELKSIMGPGTYVEIPPKTCTAEFVESGNDVRLEITQSCDWVSVRHDDQGELIYTSHIGNVNEKALMVFHPDLHSVSWNSPLQVTPPPQSLPSILDTVQKFLTLVGLYYFMNQGQSVKDEDVYIPRRRREPRIERYRPTKLL